MSRKVVVITGASKGLGYEVAKFFAANDYQVISLSRSIKESDNANIEYMSCDITNPDQVERSAKSIYEKYKRVDIVLANAGFGISGSIEFTPNEQAQRNIKTNFEGSFYVTKYFLPYLRESKGKMVFTSSVAAIMAIPYQAFYSATKAAVSSFADCLRNEVRPFGVQVMHLLPGDIQTTFTENREKQTEDGPYEKYVKNSVSVMEKDEINGMTVEYAAKKIYKYITRKRMPNQVVIGPEYRLLVLVSKLAPRRLLNWVLFKLYGGDKK